METVQYAESLEKAQKTSNTELFTKHEKRQKIRSCEMWKTLKSAKKMEKRDARH